jgi:hypothetical protein
MMGICNQQCDIWVRPNGDGLQLQTPCLVLSSADESSPCGVFLGGPMGDQRIAMDTQWTNGPTKVYCFPSAFAALSSRSVRRFAERLAMSQPCSLLFLGQRIVYTSFGGVLKWGYPKSSKSLEHLSIEIHGFGDYPF